MYSHYSKGFLLTEVCLQPDAYLRWMERFGGEVALVQHEAMASNKEALDALGGQGAGS